MVGDHLTRPSLLASVSRLSPNAFTMKMFNSYLPVKFFVVKEFGESLKTDYTISAHFFTVCVCTVSTFRLCLHDTIMNAPTVVVNCPFDDGNYTCQVAISEREMRVVSVDYKQLCSVYIILQ